MSRHYPPDHLILKRRQAEDERRVYEDHNREQRMVGATATWEMKTDAAIGAARVQQRFEQIRQMDAAAVEARRRRLGAMLAAEQAGFEAQLDALDETPEQAKARMIARATELKDKREAERQAYVSSQLERQWRLACDPLREQDSKLILKATNAARAYQLGEKMRALEMEEAENRTFDELWERDRLAKLGREEADASARAQMDAARTAVLDRQVHELHDYRQRERALAEEEAALLREQAALEREESRKVEAIKQQMVDNAYAELDAFNVAKKSALYQSVTREKAEDAARLAAQLEHEAAMEGRESEAKRAMQAETRLFAEHMIAQKREVLLQEGVADEARQQAQDEAWSKRLAVWGAEQEAREMLMAQVLDERRIQVMTKLEQEQIHKLKEAEARHKLEEELARINQLEASKVQASAATRMEHRSLLEHQIKEKAYKKAAAEFNKVQEKAAAERAEAQYQATLNSQLSRTMAQMSKYK